MSRNERLAALNGHSLVFVCFGCGGVHRIDKAVARIGTSANLISADCLVRAYRKTYPHITVPWERLLERQARETLTGAFRPYGRGLRENAVCTEAAKLYYKSEV